MVKTKEEGAQFVQYFGPVLDALRALGGSGKPEEVVERIAQDLQIPDEVQNEALPSGELRYRNQVHWARFYLVREGLLASSRRGVWSLTERGARTRLSPEESRSIFLKWVKIFQEQRKAKSKLDQPIEEQVAEELDTGFHEAPQSVLGVLQGLTPSGFERFCRRLLREAGFSQVDVTGGPNDGGIDGAGTLEINALVSFKVLFQCKRYHGSVTPMQVRDFRGAMTGRADKGIILTTGTFTAEARREASRDGAPPIELVDGEKLVSMLEDFELGLKPKTVFEVDLSFFQQFRD